MSQYPQNLEAALGRPLKFPPATLKAVKAFARSKPWRGTLEERQSKFRQLHADLCRIYCVTVADSHTWFFSEISVPQEGGN